MPKHTRHLKKAIKKVARPLVRPAIHIAHTKIGDKQIFINRYTMKVPYVKRGVSRMQSIMLISKTANERHEDYIKWFKKNKPNKDELTSQKRKQKQFSYRPLISVVVPTYNTKPEFLRECIESVQQQTYVNWELCIADDASTNKQIQEILEEYSAQDNRIKYTVRKKNGHICQATNSALDLAKGEFVALLDHDDVLWPNALFEVTKVLNTDKNIDFIYTDEDKVSEDGTLHMEPFFKPDWSPEFLRSVNYITHFSVIRKNVIEKAGRFRTDYEGAQDWDLFLRISRITDRIVHVPKVVYSWRKSANSTAEKPSAKNYAYINQKKALEDDVAQRGFKAKIAWEIPYSMWRIEYELKKKPLVSIIIPTKNQLDYIQRCLKSIHEKTTFKNYEIIIVDTGTTEEAVWKCYDDFSALYGNKLRIEKWYHEFNFSAVCDYGASKAKGEYFLFLNNDTEVITPTWVEDMLGYAQQKEVGAVGCKLLYPDGRLQHGGIVLGVGGQNGTPGIAGHYFPAFAESPPQDPMQLLYAGGTRNFTAVTAACIMVSKQKFNKVNGFDPIFKIAFNDVDFCLKLHDTGLRNVYLPHVKLYHYESVSIGKLGTKQRDPEVFKKEIDLMLNKWGALIKDDPFYHPEFRRDIASARLRVR